MVNFAVFVLLTQPIPSVAVPVGPYPAMEGLASAPLSVGIKWYTAPDPEPIGWEAPGGNSASFSISGKDSDTFQNMTGNVAIGNPFTLPDTRIQCQRDVEQYQTQQNNPTYRGIDNGKMIWDWTLIGPAVSNSAPITSKPKQPVKYINRYRVVNENLPHPVTGVLVGIPSTEKDTDVTVEQVIWINP